MTTDNRCPSFEDLRAFSLGKPTSQDWEVLAEHIAVCAECAVRLRSASQDDDSVIRHLRRLAAQGASGLTPAGTGDRPPPTAADLPGQESQQESHNNTPAAAPEAPAQVGSYQLLEPIGKGGMGVVYRARQIYLNRIVALKLVSAATHGGSRFQVEGEAVARLKHPNVVQVYECNIHEGQPYLAMEYLEGGSLAAKLNSQPLPERDAAQLVQTLAMAVQAAHECQILHRDLKPANVLLAADGTPKLGDFGLAKLLDEEEGQTATGAIMGTASYMAPEQAEGRVRDISARTDVYALGAVLYETLTGRPPFRRKTRLQTLDDVCNREPTSPARWRRGLAPDLEAVCLKCLAKDPGQRYPSAQALAEDLGRWRDGRPTLARPLGRLARCRKAARRHPLLTATLAIVLAAALTALVAWYETRPERTVEQYEAQLARTESLTLIGENGGPRWSRWGLGEKDVETSLSEDGFFSVHSRTIGLLELMPRMKLDRYRIHAEVRHEWDSGGVRGVGEVGIFFGHHGVAADSGAVHFFEQLIFNEVTNAKNRYQVLKNRLPPGTPPPPGNRAEFIQRVVTQDLPNFDRDSRISGFSVATFQPVSGRPWRKLTVTVTPEAIHATWEDQAAQETLAALLEEVRDYLMEERPSLLDTTLGPRLDTSWILHGSLGLCVVNGSASFRRVVVEPFQEPRNP